MAVNSREEICKERLEELVERHMPFLIRTISGVTGCYVSVENDEAFSVGLEAFAEAVEKFDPERGEFLSFAGLVIRSRVRTLLERERSRERPLSLEAMEENGQEVADQRQEQTALQEEIRQYREELQKFGLTLDALADGAPSHRDTRRRAVTIGRTAAGDGDTVRRTYEKKKLPIRQVAVLCGVTEKIVKTSKTFILGVMLVFVRKLPGMMAWIQEVR